MTIPARPAPDEYARYYDGYVGLVPEDNVLVALEAQIRDVRSAVRAFPAEREEYAYAPGKWSVRQVVGHMIDGERVFGYRAFTISRGEQAALPSFDENAYVLQGDAAGRALADLVAELGHARESNLIVLRRLDDATWRRRGTASGQPVSVRALAYIMAGHIRHHLEILRTRYI